MLIKMIRWLKVVRPIKGQFRLIAEMFGKIGCLIMIPIANLLTIDGKVKSTQGVVYSTDPKRAEGDNEVSYFIKGPDTEIVFAEIAGCTLAKDVGLTVPDIAACKAADETHAGSVKVDTPIRDVGPWLARPQSVTNFDDLFCAVVVDVWLANKDRNMGNVLGSPLPNGMIQLSFIDFEKSLTLRPEPRMQSTVLQPQKLWPSGELGIKLRARKPLHPPASMLEVIHSFTADRCTEIVHAVVNAIGVTVAWEDDSIGALMHRAGRIHKLAEEVWAIN